MGRRIERQLEIVNELIGGHKRTCAYFAAMFNVSIKTVKQDIFDLSLHFPIETTCGRNGGICLNFNYVFGGKLLRKEELKIIRCALAEYAKTNISPEVDKLIKMFGE